MVKLLQMKIETTLRFQIYITLAILGVGCASVDTDVTPKPRGYFRLEMPEHAYQAWDSVLPFTMEYSKYATVSFEKRENQMYWVDLQYCTGTSASFNITYLPLTNKEELRDLAIEEEKMIGFHIDNGKADDVQFYFVEDFENHVYGRVYDIIGKGSATPLHFWISDSTQHFLRATLYFNFAPNNDSLQPVIQYLRDDALHLIGSLKWKE